MAVNGIQTHARTNQIRTCCGLGKALVRDCLYFWVVWLVVIGGIKVAAIFASWHIRANKTLSARICLLSVFSFQQIRNSISSKI